MQVMKTGNEASEVLVGRQGTVIASGVTNDPTLMSMLSTGFYGNPLRTSIQEVMFNAWDAHIMGNCTDRPIEVTISESAGLVIRDYGPGIPHDQLGPIYCIYGASTKREDDASTGGFGLGSKSPYSYHESFTVVNHHNGIKNMYLAQRSCEENNGGPGLTPIMENVPTDETGLMVSIPLKRTDLNKARQYVESLTWKSGIKLLLTSNDEYSDEITTIEIDNPRPESGTFMILTDKEKQEANERHVSGGVLTAMYGGVRYPIEERDEYKKEYDILYNLGRKMGKMFFSFPPSTLCPLPNREGLNFNSQTIEAILTQFEIAIESINEVMEPAVDLALHAFARQLTTYNIPYTYKVVDMMGVGSSESFQTRMILAGNEFKELCNYCPENVRKPVWEAVMHLVFSTTSLSSFIKKDTLKEMKLKAMNTFFPSEAYKYRKAMLEDTAASVVENQYHKTISELILLTHQLTQEFKLKRALNLRFQSNSSYYGGSTRWDVYNGGRNLVLSMPFSADWRVRDKIKERHKEKKARKESPEVRTDRLINHRDQKLMQPQMMLEKVIVLAETAQALNDAYISQYKVGTTNGHRLELRSFGAKSRSMPAIVVGIGKLDKACEFFESKGYQVWKRIEKPVEREIEVETEVEGVVDTVPVPPKPKVEFYPLDPHSDDWTSPNGENGVEYSKTFINVTYGALRDYYNRTERCSSLMLRVIHGFWPETIVVYNKSQNGKLERRGAKHVSLRIAKKVDQLFSNPERLEKLYLHHYASKHGELPNQLLELPEFQKLLKLPYVRTKDKEQFNYEMRFLVAVADERCNDIVDYQLRRKVKDGLDNIKVSPRLVEFEEINKQLYILDTYHLRQKLEGMKPGEVKVFSEKLMRFLRTI